MDRTDPFAKTIVFCVDQEHAEVMREALNNLNADRVRQYPDYVCRVTSDEGDIGASHLSSFQELETVAPVILTTSQLLTTGVDVPTCKNIVIARVISSMTDFKQIIGRGTRVREDYGKLFFNILDYTGSATQLFADPEFDGDPALIEEELVDETGATVEQTAVEDENQGDEDGPFELILLEFKDEGPVEPRKFYFDGGSVQIAAEVVYELDGEGKQLRVVSYTDYARDKVRALYGSSEELEQRLAQSARSDYRSWTPWQSAGSTCAGSVKSPECLTQIRSISSATWPSTGRCGRAGSAPNASPRRSRRFSIATALRHERSSTSSLTSMRTMA